MRSPLLLLTLLFTAAAIHPQAQERVAQDPHDSVRTRNEVVINNSDAINDCVNSTQNAAAEACPIACQIRVPNKALSKADSCDTRLWTCQWPKQPVSVTDNCPAGWSGNITKDQIYEVQDCGNKLADTGTSVVSVSTCTRGRLEVSQTACPTEGEWTGGGITRTRTVSETLNKDLSTTTITNISPWEVSQIDCTRQLREEEYTICPANSGNSCLRQLLPSNKLVTSTCPNPVPANANSYVSIVTQHLSQDLVTAITVTKTVPTPVTLVCPPIDGVCGTTTHGQTLSQAPVGNALCQTGTPSAVTGTGPWRWICKSQTPGGQDSPQCEARVAPRTCPIAQLWVNNNPSTWPVGGGHVYVTFLGVTGQIVISGNVQSSRSENTTYFGGKCAYSTWGLLNPDVDDGSQETALLRARLNMKDAGYTNFIRCIVTEYLHTSIDGYGECTDVRLSGYAGSPLKVNLANKDARMNSTQETSFTLTLSDGRILESTVTGGLNEDEGWLMVHRTAGGLIKNGMLNADNWFGDRDRRSLNGYTDLAETFASFLKTDEYGQRYIPLKKLTDKQKKAKLTPGKFTNPSLDLRILDANGKELFASDYFTRIYVDYTNAVEGDGPDGISGNNLILERAIAQTVQGEFHGTVDQWFVLENMPADYSTPTAPTRSKVLPAPATTPQPRQ